MTDPGIGTERVKCDFVIIAHRWMLPDGSVKPGGIDRTKDYLLGKGRRIVLLEHPLTTADVDYEYTTESCLSLLEGTNVSTLSRFSVKPSANPWRWMAEVGVSSRAVTERVEPGFTAFAADPLCGLASLGLKRRGLAEKSVLHCTDYADRRFNNPLLNTVYRHVTLRNLRRSDLVLCVSRTMEDRFGDLCPDGNYMFFPNTPDFDRCPRLPVAERGRDRIVLLGVGREAMRHDVVVAAIGLLRARNPGVELHVIGGGGGEALLADEARRKGLESCVKIHGFMAREEALEFTARCRAGIVLYDDSVPWNRYRDSLKIREYTACGLPCICDSSTATAREARDAGAAIVAEDAPALADALDKLITDDTLYTRMSKSAPEWAKANDKTKYLDALMERLFSGPATG